MPEFKPSIHHFLVVCLLESPLSPPCLSFFIYAVGIMIDHRAGYVTIYKKHLGHTNA